MNISSFLSSGNFCKTIFLLFILILMNCSISSQDIINKENTEYNLAIEYFNKKKYDKAIPLFANLLSTYSRDPLLNYYYGICLLETGNTSASPDYLKFAATQQTPVDVYFYLAKSYHYNYDFYKAINLYNRFKNSVDDKIAKKLEINHLINNCYNAIYLTKDFGDLKVLENVPTTWETYFNVYNRYDIGGKIIEKPTSFKTSTEIIKNENLVMFLPQQLNIGDYIYFAGYNKDTTWKKDIFRVQKTGKNQFSQPENLGKTINTPFDEDFPFISDDGTTLYFCSKGHYSMGGYDIYKSVLNESDHSWSPPENLDFPINTPYDDLLYVEDVFGRKSLFMSNRDRNTNELTIYVTDRTFKGNLIKNAISDDLIRTGKLKTDRTEKKDTVAQKNLLEDSLKLNTATFGQVEKEYQLLLSKALEMQHSGDSLQRLIRQYKKDILNINDNKTKNAVRVKLKKCESEYDSLAKIYTGIFKTLRDIEINLISKNMAYYHITGEGSKKITLEQFYQTQEIKELLGHKGVKSILQIQDEIIDHFNNIGQAMAMRYQIEELNKLMTLQDEFSEKRKTEKRISRLKKEQMNRLYDAYSNLISSRQKEYAILSQIKNDVEKNEINSILEQLAFDFHNQSNFFKDSSAALLKAPPKKEISEKLIERLIKSDSMMTQSLILLQKAILTWLDFTIITSNEDELSINIFDRYNALFQKDSTAKQKTSPIPSPPEVNEKQFLSDTIKTSEFIDSTELNNLYKVKEYSKTIKNDFELQSSPVYSDENPIPMNIELPQGIIYRIQLGVFSKPPDYKSFSGLSPVSGQELTNGSVKYYVGIFISYQAAQDALRLVQQVGFKDAFVVAYQDKSPIPVVKAQTNEPNKTKPSEEKKYENPTENKSDVVFKIQIGAYKGSMPEELLNNFKALAGNKPVEEYTNNAGIKVYTIGNFYTFEESQNFRNYLTERGHTGIFIIAFKNGEKIAIAEALKMTNR